MTADPTRVDREPTPTHLGQRPTAALRRLGCCAACRLRSPWPWWRSASSTSSTRWRRSAPARLHDLTKVVPLGVAQGASAATVVAGMLLIMLGQSLRRRKRRAWRAALALSVLTMVLHVVKGLDVEEAVASPWSLVVAADRCCPVSSTPRAIRGPGCARR